MPIFTRDDRAILFVHVPKTGGTSVERLFTGSGWKMNFRMTRKTHPTEFDFRSVSPQHYHARLLRSTLRLARFEEIFLLVRDPLARFRSEYAHRRKDPADGSEARVSEWAEDILARYARNPMVLDNHLRPQHEFLLPRAHVYRYEDTLEAMVEDLNARLDLGLPSSLERHLDSSASDRLNSSDVEVSPALAARLREFYAGDYEEFGYT